MRPRWQVVSALGVFEILAWGSSFYLPAVLAVPVAADTGWPLPLVVAGVSVGLVVAALASPRIGAAIGARGGRPVLAAGAVLLASGLVLLASAPVLPVFLLGWLVIGLGMGMSLYDAGFATLGSLYGSTARPAITTLTLWGGFASTVCWPLSALLVEWVGWRGACLAYAGLHLAVSLPLVFAFVPPIRTSHDTNPVTRAQIILRGRDRLSYLLLASMLVLAGAIMGLMSVHLLTLLQARGETLAAAVSLGALIGPAQVGARLVEMAGRGRHHPIWTLAASVSLLAAGMLALATGFPIVAVSLLLYGAGNGLLSIARGTVPLAIFETEAYAEIMGRLARPALIAQALAPTAGAAVLSSFGAGAVMAVLAMIALANVALLGLLVNVRASAR